LFQKEIKMKKLINKKLKIYRTFLAWGLIVLPVIAYWHIELATQFIDNIYFTNGFIEINPIKVYHFHMWGVFIINWATAFYLLITNE